MNPRDKINQAAMLTETARVVIFKMTQGPRSQSRQGLRAILIGLPDNCFGAR
jgi:hypothetical protein